MSKPSEITSQSPRRFSITGWISVACLLGIAAALWFFLKSNGGSGNEVTFVARRGPLDITVLNGGSIESLESQEIRSTVRGEPVKILKLVDEGYTVTDEDVRTNKVLIELDASKLQQNLVERDVTFQSTLSSLTQAQQDYEIQQNQNRVDIRTTEQEARFAFMDLEKYLGDKITRELVDRLDLREHIDTNVLAAMESGQPDPSPKGIPSDPVSAKLDSGINVDFSQFAKTDLLGDGQAKQELRKREDEVLLAKTELSQATTKLAGSRRLAEKNFVTKTEIENDQIAADKARLKLESSETSRDLFVKYEFPKQAQENVGKYDKALRALERTRKETVSKFAQKRASMKSAEGRYEIEKHSRIELLEQITNCVIKATKPGMIVYGGGEEEYYWGGRDPIRVGSQVFERQAILTIPDTSKMGVKLGIHESHIKKVSKGLKCRIKADAFPDEVLEGEVTKVGVLPDSRNRWMNPDMKLYICTIAISGTRPWVKPGMSAKIEILVKQLANVVHIPMQAVNTRDGKTVIYIAGRKPEAREVEVGEFNDEFIEIKKGLDANTVVLMRAPDSEKQASENYGARTTNSTLGK